MSHRLSSACWATFLIVQQRPGPGPASRRVALNASDSFMIIVVLRDPPPYIGEDISTCCSQQLQKCSSSGGTPQWALQHSTLGARFAVLEIHACVLPLLRTATQALPWPNIVADEERGHMQQRPVDVMQVSRLLP